jgi:Phage integrase family
MGSWRHAWRLVCKAAKVRYRPHDMRHTFISRLAENPSVSEQTIKALAGHVSRQMLERYSHIRSQAKQAAIQALEEQAVQPIPETTGHKSGTVAETPRHKRRLNLWKQIVGPVGFEPTTNGL